MSKLAHQITALRTSLCSADMNESESFSTVFQAFLDIADEPDLIAACEPIEDQHVRQIVESTSRHHLRDQALGITMLGVLRHGPTGLFHGSFFAGTTVAAFFYFAEDQQGLVAFNDGTAMAHYYRVTASEVRLAQPQCRPQWSRRRRGA